MTVAVKQQVLRLFHLGNGFHHMNGYADCSRLISDSAGYRLANPPRRIGGELVALCVVKLLDSLDKTDIPLLNEVKERHTPADIVLRNADNKAQVCLDKAVSRRLVALGDFLCKDNLLIGGKQRHLADFLEVDFHGVADAHRGFGFVVELESLA